MQSVSGAGGRTLYNVREDDRRLAFASDAFGALRLELRPGAARYAFVAADGSVLAEGTIGCRPVGS